MTLYDRIRAERRCPVCGTPAVPENEQTKRMMIVRYECTATFGVSEITQEIEAYEACPTSSRVQAVHLTIEAKAEQARRDALKEGA